MKTDNCLSHCHFQTYSPSHLSKASKMFSVKDHYQKSTVKVKLHNNIKVIQTKSSISTDFRKEKIAEIERNE